MFGYKFSLDISDHKSGPIKLQTPHSTKKKKILVRPLTHWGCLRQTIPTNNGHWLNKSPFFVL